MPDRVRNVEVMAKSIQDGTVSNLLPLEQAIPAISTITDSNDPFEGANASFRARCQLQ